MPSKPRYDKCTLWHCDDKHYAHGLCSKHYQNWLRYGDVLPIRKNQELLVVLEKVDDFRAVLLELMSLPDAIIFHEGLGGIYRGQCRYCGAYTEDVSSLDSVFLYNHSDDCVILKIRQLLEETSPSDEITGVRSPMRLARDKEREKNGKVVGDKQDG